MGFRKKLRVRSTATLHDFFGPPASFKKQKNKTPAARSKDTRTSKNEAVVSPQDIIVIDSDSEDESRVSQVPRAGGKRRRLSESSDEVEFVDQAQAQKPITTQASRNSTKSRCEALRNVPTKIPLIPPDQILFAEPISMFASNTASCPKEVAFPSFGKPSLLFPTAAHPPSSSTSLSFGPSTLLPSTSDELLSSTHRRPPSCPSPAPGVQSSIFGDPSSKVDFNLTTGVLEHDWGTGDDEKAFEPLADDEGDDYDLTISTPSSGSAGQNAVLENASKFTRVLYETHSYLGCGSPKLSCQMDSLQTVSTFVFAFASSSPWAFSIS